MNAIKKIVMGLAVACAAVSASATQYYLCGKDAASQSSMSGTGSAVGWATTKGGTRATREATAGNEYIVDGTASTHLLRSPQKNDNDYTFPGDSLTFVGGELGHAIYGGKALTINNLIIAEGGFCQYSTSRDTTTHILNGGITVRAGGEFYTQYNSTKAADIRPFDLRASISGPGTVRFDLVSTYNDAPVMLSGDNSGFTGQLKVVKRGVGVRFDTTQSYLGETATATADGILLDRSALLFEAEGTVGPNRGITVMGNSKIAAGTTVTISSPLAGDSSAALHVGDSSHTGVVVLSDASEDFEGTITVDYGTLYLKGDAVQLQDKCTAGENGAIEVEDTTKITVLITDYLGEIDGALHSATVDVQNPAEGYEIRWAEVSDNPVYSITEPPAYSTLGSHTNLVQVTAPGFDPFYGTCVVTIVERKPYYLVGNDAGGKSSMASSGGVGWTDVESSTTKTLNGAVGGENFCVTRGRTLRSPQQSGAFTFPGQSLIFVNGELAHKISDPTKALTIDNLIVDENGYCKYSLAVGAQLHVLAGGLTVREGGAFNITPNSQAASLELRSSVSGAGTICMTGTVNLASQLVLKGDNSAFKGRLSIANFSPGAKFETASAFLGDTATATADGISLVNSKLSFEVTGTIGPNRGITVAGSTTVAVAEGETVTISSPLAGDSSAALHIGDSTHTGDVVLSDASAGFEGTITVDYGTLYLKGDAAQLESKCTAGNNGEIVVGGGPKVTVVVTPTAGQAKMVGEADPTLTYTLSQAIAVEGALLRAEGETAGDYAINLGTLGAVDDAQFQLALNDTLVYFSITNAVGPMTATVVDASGPADGSSYSCSVSVSDPAEGWTALWATVEGEYVLATAPKYGAEGVYTNFVKVSAAGYFDFYGTGVVTVTAVPIPEPTSDKIVSTADEMTRVGDDVVLVFRTVGEDLSLSIPEDKSADILIVGGGGGGGGCSSGGGGAGGLIYRQNMAIAAGAYTIRVGAGGDGAGKGAEKGGGADSANAKNGDNSSITAGSFNLVALGGGAGGGDISGSGTGRDGGSGGGAGGGGDSSEQSFAGGAALQPLSDQGGFGCAGGASRAKSNKAGGGGGGAGGAGTAPTTSQSGCGGIGLEISITGEPVWYAGGGGAGATAKATNNIERDPGFGGSGGGGNGGTALSDVVADDDGCPGVDGTGGGGGAGGRKGTVYGRGGAGGSGIVIVRLYNAAEEIEKKTPVAEVIGAEGPESRAKGLYCTLVVTDPKENWAATWYDENGEEVGATAPVYNKEGLYTNVVKMTSFGYEDFYGTGVVTVLPPLPLVALTIPEIDHATVAGVTFDGVPAELGEGVYLVEQGTSVTVVFEPESGYALSTRSMTFPSGTEDFELPAEGRPVSVEIASNISINEVMASNGTTLMTQSGVAGIDWVELYNASAVDMDLTGCYFGNDPTKAPNKWPVIKGSCVVPAKGYKVLWCDGDKLCADWADDEAHVECNISTTAGKHTIFLASAADPAKIVQQMTMPGMMKNVTYGLGHLEKTLLAATDAAEYKVGEGEWQTVRGPVGLSETPVNFTVTAYSSTIAVDTLEKANTVIADSSKWADEPVVTPGVEKIAYRGADEEVNFDDSLYSAFPVENADDTVFVVEGSVKVPRDGLWTFAVASDDGFRLELSNPATGLFSMEEPQSRTYSLSSSAFSLTAGSYKLRLVYFNHDNDAALDLSVAEGDFTVDEHPFSTTDFTLVGAAGSPVTHGGVLSGELGADVADEMPEPAETLAWRGRFTLAELPAEGDVVTLKLRYSDALALAVNSTPVEPVAAPASPTILDIVLDNNMLKVGENEIVIEAAGEAAEDGELVIGAQVTLTKSAGSLCYFREPTPGAANTTHGYGAMTPEVAFGTLHGYKTEPFTLALTCAEAPQAAIYYTLDGTSPTTASTLYRGPFTVSSTTCVRAAVPQENSILQKDSAATYIFLDDVLQQQQGVVPAGFPASGAVNGHAFRYGLNQTVVNGADREKLLNGFTNSIATMSVVVDPKNLFDAQHGIYVNPSGDGKDWERQMMLEQFNPVGDATGFSVPAGIRIRGGASRKASYAKHSLRFFFRGEYGMGSLEYPLFGDEGAETFDKVDLRTSQNYSWSNLDDSQDTFIHECFSRDSQGAMGEHYTRSRYYNLFINGQYWGLYQTQERGDEDFAETYNGGAADTYDVIKSDKHDSRCDNVVSEGTDVAWDTLRTIAIQGFDGAYADNYCRVLGLNPDGTRNPEYPILLNPTNLMVYMISVHYACDSDSPASVWGKHPNNVYALRDRVDTGNLRHDGFFFLRHDAEHSLGLKTGYAKDYSQYDDDPTGYGVTDQNPGGGTFLNFANFTPSELHFRLCKNPQYRRAFADVFYKHCLKAGGAMTAPVARARFEKRMAEISDAIVGECARWSTDVSKRNRTQWVNVCSNNCLAGFIDVRMPQMLSQYRARGWYPSIDAATAVDGESNPIAEGAVVEAGERVYLTGADQTGVTVYYTTDGSDPWLANGDLNPAAHAYDPAGLEIPAEGAKLAMRAHSAQGEWSALDTVTVKGQSQGTTAAEALRVAAIMSSCASEDGDSDDFLVLTNLSDAAVSLANVKLVAWNQKKKSEADPSLVIVFDAAAEIAAGGTLTLTAADFETYYADGKLANSDVGIRLYDISGVEPVLFQDVFVSASWFGKICDGNGAYFIAKEFGAEVKDVSQWKPSETWVARNLRFYEIEGIPAEGNDGSGEYFVLSNLSDSVELDLTGVTVVIGKQSEIESGGDSAAKCKLTLANGTAAAHSTVKFTQPDYAASGWEKISDGDLILKLYDAEGTLVQYSEIAQKSFIAYKDGLKALRATSFERETATTDWTEVDLPQSGAEVEGDGYRFYLTGEFAEPAVITPEGETCCVVLDGATVPGLTFDGAGEFTVVVSNANEVTFLSAGRATVVMDGGEGTLKLEGAGTLATVSNLYVRSGTFAVKSTGVPATKTPVVNVLGSVEQTGGAIDIDLDVATDLQIYGIYVANKDMDAKFMGGTLTAKVGGAKSAAIYGNKGSVDPKFSGDIAVTVSLTGPEARFVNAEGNVKLEGGTFNITMPDDCTSLTNARVFKATKDIRISGGTFTAEVPAAGSEIFSSDRLITVSGGVLSLEAADDCFSATGDITITDGIVHALSTAGDAIDSNGSVSISGGKVFAFTLSEHHDAIDVDPVLTEESSVEHNIIIGAGATVVAVGGNQDEFHAPDAGSTAVCYAEKGLTTSKKYVELTGVLAGDSATTTTVLSVSWKDRHVDTFTLIAAMPGYDGTTYGETDDKPTDVYPETAHKLNDAISGVFVRETVETIEPEPGIKVGDNLTATFENGVCTISGTGAMWDGDALAELRALAITNLVIGEGITSISASAFEKMRSIHNVTIGSTVTSIGQQVFHKCYNLTNIVILTGATAPTVGDYAFFRCNSLMRITVRGDSSVNWGEKAFTLQAGIRINSDTGLPDIYPIPEIVDENGYVTVLYGTNDLDGEWEKIESNADRANYRFFKIKFELETK